MPCHELHIISHGRALGCLAVWEQVREDATRNHSERFPQRQRGVDDWLGGLVRVHAHEDVTVGE